MRHNHTGVAAQPGIIYPPVNVGTQETCPAGGCVGQAWKKDYCIFFDATLAKRRSGRKIMYIRSPECVSVSTHEARSEPAAPAPTKSTCIDIDKNDE